MALNLIGLSIDVLSIMTGKSGLPQAKERQDQERSADMAGTAPFV